MKKTLKQFMAGFLSLSMVLGGLSSLALQPETVEAAQVINPQATLTVDLSPEENTGDILHGAAGFLYGVSSEDVPTTNTIVPLKSKVLVTKGALGTEHPYGDALDVAKTFLESGGIEIQMYNSNYYGKFGVTASIEQFCDDLKNYICPAVVAWKEAWKEEHGTPEDPKDHIGAAIDIDKAIVYIPINEGTPSGGDTQKAWKSYYDAIHSVDPNATMAGPNEGSYNGSFTWGQSEETFVQFCADNNCMPDVYTWHEFDLAGPEVHVDDFNDIWYNRTDWTKYNEINGTTGIPEMPQISFNEYAETYSCGVPGRLINWISRIEDEKATGAMPFWHQANNLNDLAAGANEGNGVWWMAKWYGDMSGTTQPVETSTRYNELYGLSTMDEAKKLSTTVLGGFTGDITVQLDNLTKTDTFKNETAVHVMVQEAMFTGFHGALNEPPVILEGAYPINEDGSVTITIPDTLYENAYNVTVAIAGEDELVGLALSQKSGDVYEAENAALSGGAQASDANTNPTYYMSSDGKSGNRAVNMPSGAQMTYTIEVPVDGLYQLDFNYANGQGTVRNNMYTHNPVNLHQTFSLDGGKAETLTMESTLFQTMTGTKTLYYDLKAGEHTITIKTLDSADDGMLYHDFVRVSYEGVYGLPRPAFNKVYEAELADVNRLIGRTDSTVTTENDIKGYSGSGYVNGLHLRSLPEGGGIRNVVVVEESGLYNVTLRYHAEQTGKANIYVGNTAVTLDRVNKTVDLKAGADWQEVTASIYLQKGINIVDLDLNVDAALDYMRVRALSEQAHTTVIEAEDTIPAEFKETIQVAESEGASEGKYVVGIKGEYNDAQYLEFTYDAPAAGKYQLQVFHSNEDLAGDHSYNIKSIDKYAVVDVNDTVDYPRFENVIPIEGSAIDSFYFVDCGDHDPSTVSVGDAFGTQNSVTDQMYGEDAKTGYKWGVVTIDEKDVYIEENGGVYQSADDKAVYTTHQKALSNSESELVDGQSKEYTFRYAHGQDSAGISPRYVAYQFELEPGKYDVTVGMSNSFSIAGNPTVNLIVDGMDTVSNAYEMGNGATQEQTTTLDLTNAKTNADGRVELLIKATTDQPSVQMTHILITEPGVKDTTDYFILPPGDVKVPADQVKDIEGIYTGELADGFDWYLDFTSIKNDTNRFFFINTFSDDTFREKTITVDLKKGENKIRLYNDNSWNVTFGGTQSFPGLEYLPNYTPNFDKFMLTPMALDEAVSMAAEYTVSIVTTADGIALGDKNIVEENGEYTLTLMPEEEKTIVNLLINGEEYRDQVVYDEENDVYTLIVKNVNANQDIEVYFASPDIPRETLEALYNEYKDKEQGTYSASSWTVLENAMDAAKEVLENDNSKQWEINKAYNTLKLAADNLRDVQNLMYFVDCGDHDVETLSTGDDFGMYNSVTDQMYGKDKESGRSWGLVMIDDREKETPGEGGIVSSPDDKAVYTNFQKALSNAQADLADGQKKEATFRYAHGQDGAGINPRYVAYQFELEPGDYDVTVGMSNYFSNAPTPTVNLIADGVETVSQSYSIGNNNTQEQTLSINLKNAKTNDNGMVELMVKGTTSNPTLLMTFISIAEVKTGTDEPIVLPYEDVKEGDWFYKAVYYSYIEKLMTGMDEKHFGPYGQLSRAQFALILYRMEGSPSVKTDKTFGDITGDEWYGQAVLWAAEAGVVGGYIDGNFGPADNITREQMALMMYRYAKYIGQNPDASGDYSKCIDAASVSEFAKEAMSWAYGNGIITGKENGTLIDPQGQTARCEAAAIIQRFMK